MADAEQAQVAKCLHCAARYDTSKIEPGKLFSCSHCGHILQAPGVRDAVASKGGSFGEVAVDLGYITPNQLEEALAIHDKTGKRIGDILVKQGALKSAQVKKILELQGASVAQLIPGYEIVQKLGQGGMGAVYKALHLKNRATVAMKVLDESLAARDVLLERFHREARAAIQLDHPHIVKGYEEGEAGDIHYFAMEYIHGKSVGRVLKKRKAFGEKRSLDVIRQIAKALDFANGHGVVHRDIKPDNIMIDRNGKVKLADYGLVKFADDIGEAVLTNEGQVMGTPRYISPEQAAGLKSIDIRSDIYSLGATLYHLLVGQPPFRGPGLSKTLKQHIKAPLPDPRGINPKLSDTACAICCKMLAKDPAERYQTPAELLADIKAYFLGTSGKTTASNSGTGSAVLASDPNVSSGSDVRLGSLSSASSASNVELADPVAETIEVHDDFIPIYRHPWVLGGVAFLGGLAAVLTLVSLVPKWVEQSAILGLPRLHESDIVAEAPAPDLTAIGVAPPTQELQAARMLRDAYLTQGEAREDLILKLHASWPESAVAKTNQPAYRKIKAKRDAEDAAAALARKERETRERLLRNTQSNSALANALQAGSPEAVKVALRKVVADFPDTDGERDASARLAKILKREQEEAARMAEEKAEAERRNREEAKRALEREIGPPRNQFLIQYRDALRREDITEAIRLTKDLYNDSEHEKLKSFAKGVRRDLEDLITFLQNVERGLNEAKKNKTPVALLLKNGTVYKGTIFSINSRGMITVSKDTGGRSPSKHYLNDLSEQAILEFYKSGSKAGDPDPALVIAIYRFASGAAKEVILQSFKDASDVDPRKSFHQELLYHSNVSPEESY